MAWNTRTPRGPSAQRAWWIGGLTAVAIWSTVIAGGAWALSDPEKTWNVEILGQAGGMGRDVEIEGQYLYFCEGRNLAILDVSDPSSPVPIGRAVLSPGRVGLLAFDLSVSGGLALIGDNQNRVYLIDVSDPSAPRTLATYPINEYIRNGVHLVGHRAYVASRRLRILDVSDPSSPTLLSVYEPPGTGLSQVFVAGSTAYATQYNGDLIVIDVSDPASPALVGSFAVPGNALGVVVEDNLAYVAAPKSGLVILDVSDPSSPTLVSALPTGGSALRIEVVGAQAYLIESHIGGLKVIDITEPSSPTLRGALALPYATGLGVGGALAGCARQNDLQLVDVSHPASPTITAVYPMPAETVYTAAALEGLLYVSRDIWVSGEHRSEFQILDVNNPRLPKPVGSCELSSAMQWNLAVFNDVAFLSDYDLTVVDVADPTAPAVLGVFDLSVLPDADCISAGRSYLVCRAWGTGSPSRGIRLLDITDPSSPTMGAVYPVPTGLGRLRVVGNLVYAPYEQGLLVVDLSDPSSPVLHTSYPLSQRPSGLDVEGDIACLGGDLGTLWILNIGDPSSPTLLNTYHIPNPRLLANRVYLHDGLVYAFAVPTGDVSLGVIDIGDPSSPTLCGFFVLPYERPGDPVQRLNIRTVSVADGIVYLAAENNGLWAVRYSGPRSSAAVRPAWEWYE